MIYTYIHILNIYICIYICIYIYIICIYIYVYICVYIYVYIYMYMYIYMLWYYVYTYWIAIEHLSHPFVDCKLVFLPSTKWALHKIVGYSTPKPLVVPFERLPEYQFLGSFWVPVFARLVLSPQKIPNIKKNTKNCWEDLQFSDTLRPMTPNWCCRESPPSDTPLLKIPDFLSSLCQSVIHQNFKVLMKVWIRKSTINGGFSRKPRLIPEGKQPFCFFT